jgi:hypothetical protein
MRGFAALGSPEPSSPAALGYEIAGGTLKKVGQGLTWTLGLQDIDERDLKALRRLGGCPRISAASALHLYARFSQLVRVCFGSPRPVFLGFSRIPLPSDRCLTIVRLAQGPWFHAPRYPKHLP